MSFEDLNNDILLIIMNNLPVNYLISINKLLNSLHTEYYYKLRLQKDCPHKILNIHRDTYKNFIDCHKSKQFEALLSEVIDEIESPRKDKLIIYIMKNMRWKKYSLGSGIYQSINRIGKFNFTLHNGKRYDSSIYFRSIYVYWKDFRITQLEGDDNDKLTKKLWKYVIC